MRHAWSIAEAAKMLDLNVDATRTLVNAVLEGPRDVIAVEDLKVLRRAIGLAPPDAPVTALPVQKVGKELVVRNSGTSWNAQSGQGLLELSPPVSRGAPWLKPVPSPDALELFQAAVQLEESGSPEAIDAYTEVLAVDPRYADAHVNRGRLLHQAGRLQEAEAHYFAALVSRPTDVTATFNLAVVLEDLGRIDDAILRYRDAIELDPEHVDAYFNLARLYEKKGEKVAALRHLKDYRRLSNQP